MVSGSSNPSVQSVRGQCSAALSVALVVLVSSCTDPTPDGATTSARASASVAPPRVRDLPAPERDRSRRSASKQLPGDPQDLAPWAPEQPQQEAGPKLCDGEAYAAPREPQPGRALSSPDGEEFVDVATRNSKTWVLTSRSLYRLRGDQLEELPGSTCIADYRSRGAGMVRHASLAVDRSGVHVGQFWLPSATFRQSLWTGGKWRCGLPPHERGSGNVSLHDSGGSHWLWMQGALTRTLPAPHRRLPHAGYLTGPLVRSEVPGRPVAALVFEEGAPRHRYFDGFRWVERGLADIELEDAMSFWHEDGRERLWGAAKSATLHGRTVEHPLLVHDDAGWHTCRSPLTRVDALSIRDGVLWSAGARQVLRVNDQGPRLIEVPIDAIRGIEITGPRSAWVWGTTGKKSQAVELRLTDKGPRP